MKVKLRLIVALLLLAPPFMAVAQTTTPPESTGIEWGQYFDEIVVPLLGAALVWVVHTALNKAAEEATKLTGIQFKQAAIDRVALLLTNYAGHFIANGEPDIMDAKVTTGSPGIDDLANKMLAAIPGELEQAGITPATIPDLIVGAIGHLQAISHPTPVTSIPIPIVVSTEGKLK